MRSADGNAEADGDGAARPPVPVADVQAVASARTTAARAAAVVLLSDEVTKQPSG
jgi:hypothetical protein